MADTEPTQGVSTGMDKEKTTEVTQEVEPVNNLNECEKQASGSDIYKVCHICNIIFTCSKLWKLHQDFHNKPDSRYCVSCKDCGQQFMCFLLFELHQKQHQLGFTKDTCPLCYTKFSSYQNVVKHYRKVHRHSPHNINAQSEYSGEQNGSKDDAEHHNNDTRCKCVQCTSSIQSTKIINNRELLSHPHCKDCDQFSQSPTLLNLHQRQHELGLSNQTCPLCLQTFSASENLQKHFKIAHNEGTVRQNDNLDSPVPEDDMEDNSEENDDQGDLEPQRQFKTLHSGNQSDYTCRQTDATGQTFSDICVFKRLYTCKECGQHFNLQTLYRLHEKQHELGLSNKTCPLCGQTFSSFCNLGRHFKTFHKNKMTIVNVNSMRDDSEQGTQRDSSCSQSGDGAVNEACYDGHGNQAIIKYGRCQKCGQLFMKEALFKMHERQHELGLSNLQCPLCGRMFSTFGNLAKHFKQAHRNKLSSLECDENSPMNESENSMEDDSEQQSESDLQDGIESKSQFGKLHSGNQSAANITNTGSQSVPSKQPFYDVRVSKCLYTCKQCSQQFNSHTLFSLHEKQHTLGLSNTTCPLCGQTFSSFCNLGRHFKTVHKNKMTIVSVNCMRDDSEQGTQRDSSCSQSGDGTVNDACSGSHRNRAISKYGRCQKCGQLFMRESLFKMHERQHELGLSNLQCPLCGRMFSTFGNLAKHFKQAHRNKLSSLECDENSPMSESENSTEDDSEQQSESDLQDGIESKSQLGTLHSRNQSAANITNTGSQPVPSKQSFYDVRVSKYLYTCKQCSQQFNSHTLFSLHEKQHTLGLSNTICPLCGQTFSSFCNLGRHFKTVHKNKMTIANVNSLRDDSEQGIQRDSSCSQSGDGTVNEACSGSHRNRAISKYGRCQKCGQLFMKEALFKMHERQHELGLSNLQCPVCGRKFSTFSNLAKHFKQAHRNKLSSLECDENSPMNESENSMEDDSEQQSESDLQDGIEPEQQIQTIHSGNQRDS
ncbi:zinc finger protein 14-like isoform X1 [Ptychodera flava]|uniref:zinc finger protein 14-like isoform X1 n=1 Tax=Ptychodera flava TaxID=63121 RepID=UPI003969CFCB